MANESKKYVDILTAFPAGCNSGIASLLLPHDQASFAINTTFRGGYATDRPPVQKLVLDFGGDAALENAVRHGFFQGAGVYRPDFGPTQNVAQISGRLFTFTENGAVWTVAEITVPGDPNDATTAQVWMWQAEKWLIISDGSAKLPIFYDGVTSRRSYGPSVILGSVIAAAQVNPPALGETVGVTLAANWEHPAGTSGPFNVPVRFNGAIYQPISQSTSVPTYQAILTNLNAVSGATIPASSQVVVDPNRVGYLTSPATNYPIGNSGFTQINIFISASVPATSENVTFGGYVWHPPFGMQGTNLLLNSYGINYSITTFPVGTLVSYSSSHGPVITVGSTTSNFVNPAVGGTVTILLDQPYTGADGQIVWIGNEQYSITGVPLAPPGATLYLINLTDTKSGTAYGTAPYPFPTDISSIPEIPACRMGAYGLKQNWFSNVDGLSFGPSDAVGSSSGSQAYNYRDAVLKTTDLEVMGWFPIPNAGEIITSMTFVATLDVSLGQGPLQIGVASGFFSVKAPFTLMDFQGLTNAVSGDLVTAPITDPILTKSLIGFGPVAQNSTILANSDTVFRSFEGVGSLILGRRQFSDIGGNTPISREMTRTIDLDNKSLLSYSSAIVFDNRLRMTCSPQVSGQGVFHMGELVLNYDLISSLRGKASPVWDALWTANNILQYLQGLFGPVSRAFAFTLNITDSQIELYELLPTGDQHFDNGAGRIRWILETPILFNAQVKTLTDLARLMDGEMYLSDVVGQVDAIVLYRPVFYPCWRPWHSFSICSDMSAANAKAQTIHPLGFGEPDPKDCDPINNQSFREGVGFQLRLEFTGHCKLWGLKVLGHQVPNPAFTKPAACSVTIPVCTPLNCDVESDLRTYSLDGLPALPS